MWLVLTGLAVLFRSLLGIATKVFSNKMQGSAYTQATLLTAAGAFFSLFLIPLFGTASLNYENAELKTVLLVILSQGVGNIFYFAALKHLTNSTAQIAFSSVLIFNSILAVLFMNLSLSFLNIFGIILLMLAILSVISGKVSFNVKGISLMLFAAFLFSIFQLSSAELSQQVGVVAYLLITYIGATLIVFGYKAKRIVKDLQTFNNAKLAFGLPAMAAIPSLIYFVCAYFAYRMADEPPKVAILLTSQVVLTVFLSYLLLNEKDHVWRKTGAAVLVVGAAYLIKS